MKAIRTPLATTLTTALLAPAALAYDPVAVPTSPSPAITDLIVHDPKRRRDIPVHVYLPVERQAAPVVLFSHGLGGSREGSAFLGRHWAARVGMSGDSFGAVTTQVVCGQTAVTGGQRFTDPRLRAAVTMSPSVPRGGSATSAFGRVTMPWLLMTGTEDIARMGGATIGAADMAARLGVYPALPSGGKYELVLDGAEHSVFTDRPLPGERKQRNPNHHRVILALSTAFWDASLREDKSARAWLDGEGPRSVLEREDRWQRKQAGSGATSAGFPPRRRS